MRAALLCLAAVVGFLLLTTVMRTADVLVGPPTATEVGTASVTSCVEHGPVGRWGVGTSYGCTADVRWDDGRTERLTFIPGQLRPGDAEVPVYSSAERGAEVNPGRNDSARWYVAGRAAGVVLALLTFWFALGAVASLWRLVRKPAPGNPTTGRRADEWPVTEADLDRAPVPRGVWRLRLLAITALGAGALEALASIPRFDAPRRAGGFVSPWPHLESAWLVDPPSGTITVVGALVALLATLIGSSVRKDAARIVRYGQDYLRTSNFKPGRRGVVDSALLTALAVWAVVDAVTDVPAGAPAFVWFASLRDALVLTALAACWWATRESTSDMTDRMLRAHDRTDSGEPKTR